MDSPLTFPLSSRTRANIWSSAPSPTSPPPTVRPLHHLPAHSQRPSFKSLPASLSSALSSQPFHTSPTGIRRLERVVNTVSALSLRERTGARERDPVEAAKRDLPSLRYLQLKGPVAAESFEHPSWFSRSSRSVDVLTVTVRRPAKAGSPRGVGHAGGEVQNGCRDWGLGYGAEVSMCKDTKVEVITK